MSIRGRLALSLVVLAALATAGVLLLRDDDAPPARPAPPAAPSSESGRAPESRAPADDSPAGSLARVEGVVRDALTGAPLPNVDVIFAGDAGETTGASAADGRYQVSLAPGRYRARAAGVELFGLAPEPLLLEAGVAVTRFDLRVARLATISGRVVDASGQPAPGAAVSFEAWLSRERIDSSHLEPDGEARAGADGAFTLRAAPGEVLLLAEHAGARGRLELPSVAPAARLAGVEIVLPARARVRGVVRDADRRPVAGATVRAERGEAARDVQSGADGSFELMLPVGRVLLQARAAGHADSEPVQLDLRAAGRDDVQLVLGEALTLRGRVLLPDGAPAAGALVQAFPGRVLDPPQTKSDASGEFVLSGLGRDAVDLSAALEPHAPARLKRVRPPRDGLVLQLQARGRIVGRVTAGGAPVQDFTVRVDHWIPSGTDDRVDGVDGVRRLAPDGSYVLDGLQPGAYDVVVSAPGYAPSRRRGLVVKPGADTDGSVELARGAVLEGTLKNARTGGPVSAARVTAVSGHEGDAVYSDESGRFRIEDVAPGRRSLEVEHASYVRRVESGLELRAGEVRRLDIALSPLEPGKSGARAIEFAGIGAVLSPGPTGLPCVSSILPGSPAELAGLLGGDCITAIDGTPMAGESLTDAIELIRGVAGTPVRLAIDRRGSEVTVNVVRGNVRFDGEPSPP